MTDTPTEPTDDDTTTLVADPPQALPDTFDEATVAKLRKEAARYRTELQAVRTDIGTLAESLAPHRRTEVLHAIAVANTELGPGGLIDPVELADRIEPDSLRTDDGSIDHDAITQAITQLALDRPHLSIAGREGKPPPEPTPATWADVLTGTTNNQNVTPEPQTLDEWANNRPLTTGNPT